MARAYAPSTSSRVLQIPEILDIMIGFLEQNEHPACALVCRQWSEIALDALWRLVDDLPRLFGILAPLTKQNASNALEFSRSLQADDWTRFNRYARRVRHLAYDESAGALAQSAFTEIATTRTSLEILPSLNALEWNAPLRASVMFMHRNVKRFIITVPPPLPLQASGIALPSFLQDVAARMPNMTHFDLRWLESASSHENELVTFFRALPKLRKITFPRYYFTSNIAQALSQGHENLAIIEFQYMDAQGCGEAQDIYQFAPTLTAGAFPALYDFSLACSLADMANFLTRPFGPSHLTMSYIHSYRLESPAEINKLVCAFRDTCPLLKELSILSAVDVTPARPQPGSNADVVTLETLRPLFGCANLISFEILHQHPLRLSFTDLDELARKWPSLERLILNSEPPDAGSAALTLRALLPFAAHCPRLRSLGLFIHASRLDIPTAYIEHGTDALTALPAFKEPILLSMGVSVIHEEDVEQVALFLSQVCPVGADLEAGVTWELMEDEAGHMDPEMAATIDARCEKWHRVREFLPLLTQLRKQESDRARMLESSLRELSTQHERLMAQAKAANLDVAKFKPAEDPSWSLSSVTHYLRGFVSRKHRRSSR
ncbi:hypothetical protein BD626DRAFT_167728 [Schizophyllum amplum]|uniref:F-box domain-containing protein n=1 Tax=Schizophyllum amplum TaxID=97359 RepID=A0A550CQD0_9AGAR|nr:hypothetical protein BD626DRAFT_167728 [Auriculariopsis ampla]